MSEAGEAGDAGVVAGGEEWQQTVTSRVLTVAALVLGVGAAVLLVYWLVVGHDVNLLVVLLAVVFAAGACAACARVRVSVGAEGVVAESAFFGFTLARHSLDEISDARVDAVSVGTWFGWGYRVTMGASALILHSGGGLVLDLVSGKEFTITLPDPDAALAALEAAAEARGA
jgi:hypothetical protein